MLWIERHAIALKVGATLAGVTAAVELIFARSHGSVDIAPWQLGFIVLPWLLFSVCIVPLIYRSWFMRPLPRLITPVAQIAFWALVFCLSALYIQIYGGFVFGFW